VVPGAEYIAHFASDRSHMLLPSGEWSAPPPAHAPLRGSSATTAMTLPQLLDMSSLSDATETAKPVIAAQTAGRVVSLNTFLSEYCSTTAADDVKPG
jgi:N-terminal glutamine amidase